jgi:mRNA-degrading endonuclease RelE of RelBE toxin-antitoxin system
MGESRLAVTERKRRYSIEYTQDAEDDLDWFERRVQVLIDDQIGQQLAHEPTRETRNRKPHQRSRAVPADWEVRIGEYRAFYDVFEADRIVTIVVVGWKPREQLFVQGEPVDDHPDEDADL